ncbi:MULTISPECIES: hypothetical protein [Methylobacterium]|uniref:Protein of unassigned function n=2 Tax=Methylobacterium TaxID=407 RepID=A0A089NVZ0_9HYPH|nr:MULTISPECIES: hypothetical protein [Methylobacterium]ACB24531.1 hypothetical protein Mrad2831_2541 [Methylobacterium radiotolerans JCM 2831]AIQ90705.1 protein of unassigned function [Methylobacterium oryzae CBMB20]GEN01304.1 hypothetical protein MRA01_58430 [Methylobacterium radiotolerans]
MILTLESRLVENHPKRSYGFRPNPATRTTVGAAQKQPSSDCHDTSDRHGGTSNLVSLILREPSEFVIQCGIYPKMKLALHIH